MAPREAEGSTVWKGGVSGIGARSGARAASLARGAYQRLGELHRARVRNAVHHDVQRKHWHLDWLRAMHVGQQQIEFQE